MAHDHDHHAHEHRGSLQRIGTAFILNAAFAIIEFIGGCAAHSYAVISGALHDTGDLLVLASAWYLQRASVRARDPHNSYGYARYRSLGGAFTAIVLIIGAVLSLVFAINALTASSHPEPGWMMALATLGVIVNGLAFLRLKKGTSHTERGVGMHFLEDVLGWVAVLLGGVIIQLSGIGWIDPFLSIGIALFILYRAAGLLRTVLRVLMQAHPEGFDASATRAALLAIPQVQGVHDLHAWSLDGTYTVLTVHLVLDPDAEPGAVKRSARDVLDGMDIDHATIETERSSEACALEHH